MAMTDTAAQAEPGPGPEGGAPGPSGARGPGWAVLVVCCLAQFMVVLDVSIVNVAMPSMQSELGLSPSGLQWVANAYTLAFAGLLLFGGRAGDLFGRRLVLIVGLVLFTVASLVGGLSQGPATLILARAAQGVGAAVLTPATLSLLTTSFTEARERARAIGLWGATAAGGGACGAFIGGVLTDLASWRWVLFVNVPIGVLLLVGARIVLAESRGQVSRLRDLDVPGTLLVTAGLGVLVFGIVHAEDHPWGSAGTAGCLAGGAALLAAFVAVEARGANPLVPLSIFRMRALTVANLVVLFLGAATFALFYFLTLFLQEVRGMSPLAGGTALLVIPVMIITGSQIASRLVGRVGARPLILAGSLVGTAGFGWLTQISADGSYWTQVLGPGLLIGLGAGTNMVATTSAATTGVPGRLAGLASGLINTGRQMGAAIGLAVLTTVAASRTASLRSHGVARPVALTSGYARGIAVAAGLMVAAGLLALALPRRAATPRVVVTPSADADPALAAEAG
ncbi:MFS transporter [Pseudofrankia inefficax]|uniref:Drug resistance transporter, EmrB/QacA subfamily n=1 Tax=Pseudofrankia inefficax (strain DSM 45817 / CECT 9037 / DDB 130130 / EuI1c) TaxID=298654 RepID=E3JCI5_PSEI1|nr:MFS transporter [Pseudofrankia inefficax]ADP78681.1 drug resistance transporter, EmrB/QacA subfamily [Pseudofrankia inefficax]